jgi:ribosome-interacting GTPase 1
MPTNVTVEYAKAQQRYLNARTREEKMAALEEMISTIPNHKGCEVMKAQLKQRLAKLREKPESKASRKMVNIPKEGDAQVGILGMTQSGKSTLLSKLTNARPKITSHPFTTTRPEIGTFDYHGVKIQLIEIPSSFNPVFMSIAQNADSNILLYRSDDELEQLGNIVSQFRIKNIGIKINRDDDLEEVKDRIWNSLGLIRIFCKEPGKKPESKPMVMEENATVEDAAKRLHKDFVKFFRFARVWGRSAKYRGEKVGLDHILEDRDILEIHMG